MLVIQAAVDADIRRHGRDAYPHECCGALIGRGRGVAEALALPNAAVEGPRRRFLVRPVDYRAAERRAAERGEELLGYRNVRSINGGTLAWREKGYATDSEQGSAP